MLKTIYGKAPLRVSFAGGGTDMNEVFEKYGGAVINATINKFTHAIIEQRLDNKIFVNKVPLEKSDDFTKNIIKHLRPSFGFDLYTYNEIPPRRGLGSSSTYSVLLTRMIKELEGEIPDDHYLVELVYGIESEIGRCGWQDQYASAVGGFNFIEFSKNKKDVFPLRLKYRTIQELEQSLVLVFTKKEHFSADIQKKNNGMTKDKAERLIISANKIKDYMLNDCLLDVGFELYEGWKLKRNKHTTNKEIDNLFEDGMTMGAYGGKLLGAGGGGYMMFFISPKNRSQFVNHFKELDYEVLDIHFTNKGVETW